MCGPFYLTLSLLLCKVSPARAKWQRSSQQLLQPGCVAGLDWTASVGLKKNKLCVPETKTFPILLGLLRFTETTQ